MTDCIWKGREEPRALKGRHENHCADGECRGCQPCALTHCVVCGITHIDQQTCPSCVGEARANLLTLRGLWAALPLQAMTGGNYGKLEAARDIPGGEAMVAIAPGSDGRAVAWAKERGDDVSHRGDERKGDIATPLVMLVTWEEDWRGIRNHRTDQPATFDAAVTYLDEHLHWAAQHHDAFDAFDAELRQQVAHLEDILHAGDRPDTGAPCFTCNTHMEKRWGDRAQGESGDRWVCPRCGRKEDLAEYARTRAQEARSLAEWLSATDMELEYDIKPGSLRGWAAKKEVRKRKDFDTGRTVYNVAQAIQKNSPDTPDGETGDSAA